MRGTGSFTPQERPTNFREKIFREYPDGPTPLMMILGMLKSESTDDTKYNCFEQSIPDQVHVIATTSTTIVGPPVPGPTEHEVITLDTNPGAPYNTYTDPTKFFKPGHIFQVTDTGETMYVVSVNNATDLVVIRDIGSSADYGDGGSLAADYQAGGFEITIIGSAHEEGSDYPDAVHFSPHEKWNYIETFRTSLELTDDAAQTYYRTGNINENAKFDCAMQHSMEQEKAFIWGRRERVDLLPGSLSTQPMRTTGGIKFWIDLEAPGNALDGANDLATANTLTRDEFLAFLEPIYTVPGGSQNKIAFCGSTFLGVMTKYAEELGQIFLEPKEKTYGLQIRTLVHAWGELKLVNHQLFSEHPSWRGSAVIIDTRNIMYRYLKGRDTRFLRERQGNGEDKVVHEFMTKAGLELMHSRTHGYITGITNFKRAPQEIFDVGAPYT
jgi:hypothetical protein